MTINLFATVANAAKLELRKGNGNGNGKSSSGTSSSNCLEYSDGFEYIRDIYKDGKCDLLPTGIDGLPDIPACRALEGCPLSYYTSIGPGQGSNAIACCDPCDIDLEELADNCQPGMNVASCVTGTFKGLAVSIFTGADVETNLVYCCDHQ